MDEGFEDPALATNKEYFVFFLQRPMEKGSWLFPAHRTDQWGYMGFYEAVSGKEKSEFFKK